MLNISRLTLRRAVTTFQRIAVLKNPIVQHVQIGKQAAGGVNIKFYATTSQSELGSTPTKLPLGKLEKKMQMIYTCKVSI
jgi:hypothetical protein